MKKNKLFTITIILSLFFTSCFSPIFYEIRKDVKPEETTLKSPINQITRFTTKDGTEYLTVLSDQGLRYKRADSTTHDEWKVYDNLPVKMHYYNFIDSSHEGELLMGIYASSDTLYLVTSQVDKDDDEGILYSTKITLWGNKDITSNGSSWEKNDKWVKIISDDKNEFFPVYQYNDTYYHSAFSILQTNSVNKQHRKVFIRKGNIEAHENKYKTCTYYELTGTTTPSSPYTIEAENIVNSKPENCFNSVAYFGNDSDEKKNLLFFNGFSVTNETKTTDATMFYFSDNDELFYGTSASDTKKALSISKSKISALTVCSDAILIGCADWTTKLYYSNGGLFKAKLKDGIPGNSTVEFTTNASFQIPSTSYITVLLNATPEKSETESCLYCGTQIYGTNDKVAGSIKNVGLWSYYPERGNWNRE